MKKLSLTPNKGLSLSQAQSVSNLCNQRALEIDSILSGINNFSKTVELPLRKSSSTKTRTILKGKEMPVDVVELLIEKSRLHACQAFLMENIKGKDNWLTQIKKSQPDFSEVGIPERPKQVVPTLFNNVDEDFGWSQLSVNEICEYQEAEAYAAHIGQFIHKGSTLDKLRKELPNIAPIEWMTIKEGEKTPVDIIVHHKPEQLMEIHENLAKLHREYEQRVNYYKAKVKNLTTEENARIAKVNADATNDAEKTNNIESAKFQTEFERMAGVRRAIQQEFEQTRQAKIKEVAGMRIDVHTRFQPVIDIFLKQLDNQ